MTPGVRVARAAAEFTVGAMLASMQRPGNPRRVTVERFGGAIATACRTQPDLDFRNTLAGLEAADAGRVGEITAFYRSLGIRGWAEVPPGQPYVGVADALAAAGWSRVSEHCSFAGPLDPGPPGPEDAVIGVVDGDSVEEFARTLLAGHEVPDEDRAEAVIDISGWLERPGWRLYLVEVDGRPAAAGVLIPSHGAAFLANASTHPEYRRRGLQTALIRRRLEDGMAAGCDMACALAECGSNSQRNLERAGMRLCHTQVVWRMDE
jgi:ribosomal protein S18 acetylase RimI-like enzyme